MKMIESIVISEKTPEHASNAGRKVTAFLRWAGTVTLAVSALSFMVQGLEGFGPSYGNWIISGFIVVLCLCGLICGYWMKETRGARLFFGLATAFLTVQFSQISTLIYRYVMPRFEEIPPALSWWRVDPMPISVFASIVITSLILTAIVVPTSFSILARSQARRLTLGFLAGNALIMNPSRNNFLVAVISVALYIGLRIVTRRSIAEDPVHRTPEGLAALAILWIPFAIIGGRGFFYADHWTLFCLIFGISAVTLLLDMRPLAKTAAARFLTQSLGTLSAIVAWLLAAQEISFRISLIQGYEILWVMLPLAFLLHLIAIPAGNLGFRYRAGSALVAGFAALGFLLSNPVTIASFVCLLTGIALTASGLNNKEKIPFISGLICFASGVLFNLKFALDLYHTFPWASCAALGLVVLLLASYIDSRERFLLQKTRQAYLALKSWS
jgi:hypothetical protein